MVRLEPLAAGPSNTKGLFPWDGAVKADQEKGFALFPFRGYSMFPILRPGDTLIVEKGPYRNPKIGHIILYRNGNLPSDPTLTAHRIIGRDSKGLLITKGDNLTRPDVGARLADEVIGHVVCFVRRGRIVPLDRRAFAWFERPMAYLSRINWTPGIVARRLKGLLGLRR